LRQPEVRKHLFDIAEACALIERFTADLLTQITDARRIVAFRNRLIHGYASVSNEVVWGVVEGNLAVLQREIQALLDEP
jgi:uncharacterized protein with HEPN domain